MKASAFDLEGPDWKRTCPVVVLVLGGPRGRVLEAIISTGFCFLRATSWIRLAVFNGSVWIQLSCTLMEIKNFLEFK